MENFRPSPGTDIPRVSVRLAIWPYVDPAISVIGLENGWFDEVGISLESKVRSIPQAFTELVDGQVDVASSAMSTNLQTCAEAPHLKMFMVTNTYLGNYVMASPTTGAGTGGSEDVESTLDQMRGKRVAASENGSTPAFFRTALKLGGLTPDDFELAVLDDAEMVERARAGAIDYAVCGTAPHSLELMDLGFYRVFGVTDMIGELPAGDPDAVQGITHVGYRASGDFLNANLETVLRFMAVQFRIIDALRRCPRKTLSAVLPRLRAITGVDVSLDDAVRLFELFYVLIDFEDAWQLLLDPSHKLYYQTAYTLQIDTAKADGVIPEDLQVTPDNILSYRPLYQILVDLKTRYEALDGCTSPLANQAAAHYRNRNYLDAHRLLSAARE